MSLVIVCKTDELHLVASAAVCMTHEALCGIESEQGSMCVEHPLRGSLR